MQTLIKILAVLVVTITIFMLAVYLCNRVTPEQARQVNYLDYGYEGGDIKYNGFHLDEFMEACGAFNICRYREEQTTTAEIGNWKMTIENFYFGDTGSRRGTRVGLTRSSDGLAYAFGRVKSAPQDVEEQPELVFVRDSDYRQPWRQAIERSVLDDLITVVNSGNLLEDREDPLAGLEVEYVRGS